MDFNFLVDSPGAIDDKEAKITESKPDMEDGVHPDEDNVASECKIDDDMERLTEMLHSVNDFIRDAKAFRRVIMSSDRVSENVYDLYVDTQMAYKVDRVNQRSYRSAPATESIRYDRVAQSKQELLTALESSIATMEEKKGGLLSKLKK